MKKTLLIAAAMLSFGYANAQMKVGSNPTATTPTANLEVEATNGEKVIVEKATSRVGIGITSPSTKLHIAGALTTNIETVGTFNDILHVTGPSWGFGDKSRTLSWSYNLAGTPGGDGLHLFIPANVTPAAAYTDAIMNFYTDNGGANKVGINTINPATTLDVNGTTKTTNLQVTTNAGVGKVLTSDATGLASWATPTAGSNLYTADGTLTGARTVSMGTNNLAFTGTGNIGIGTTTPNRKLAIVQPGDGVAFMSGASLNLMSFESTTNSSSIGHSFTTKNSTGVSKQIAIGINPNFSSGNGIFYLGLGDGYDLLSYDLVTKSGFTNLFGGNFGVGTQTPTAKLDVAGNVRVQTTLENSTSIKTVKLAADGTLGYAYQVSAFPTINSSAQDDPIGTTGTFTGTINGNAMTYTMTNKGTSNGGYVAYYDVVIAGTGFGFVPSFVQITPAPSYIGDFLIANVVGGTITATTFQMKIRRLDASTPWSAPTPMGILAIKQ